MAYRFEPAKPEEVPGVFSLFVRRVAWMKEKRIRQWDQYYLDVYPTIKASRKRDGCMF